MDIKELRTYKTDIKIKQYTTGSIKAKYEVYTQPGEKGPIEGESNSVVKAFGFRHRDYGDMLIDSGLSRDFYHKPPFGNLNFVLRMFQKINKVVYSQEKSMDIVSQFEEDSFEPKKVLLTHMHPDHTSAIPSLEGYVEVYYGKLEDTPYYHMVTGNHLKGRVKRILDFSTGFNLEDFDSVIDVFGDKSILAISTRGHTKDHIAYLINGEKMYFVVGDAELTEFDAKRGIYINSDYGKKGELDARTSADKIRAFVKRYPEIEVLYSHG